MTVLGSGGPVPTPRRLSSAYVVWTQGRPRLLVDAGGGAVGRLAQAGVGVDALDAVLLTHTHIDHSGGLAPVVFAAWMTGRTTALDVLGPSGRDEHPGCARFCELLFGRHGAWSYLHTFEGFALCPVEVPHDAAEPREVWQRTGLSVRAVGVPHGMMPALAYRVDHAGRSVTFTGDIEGSTDALVELATGTDVLVHDQALPRRDMPHGHLHSPPADTARNAQRAGAGTLVLSHFMDAADEAIDEIEREVRTGFGGRLVRASDLVTLELDEGGEVLVR